MRKFGVEIYILPNFPAVRAFTFFFRKTLTFKSFAYPVFVNCLNLNTI